MLSPMERIKALYAQGYLYLRTEDDGDTWTGSHQSGVPIIELMRLRNFRGQVVLNPSRDHPGDRRPPRRQ